MAEFKDYLEEVMDLKRPCTIKFRDVDGAVSEVQGRIIDMDEVSGRYMIETDSGLTIGVDQIISVNDRLQVSHSNIKTKRRFLPNLQTKRFFLAEENKWITLKLTADGIRTINKNGLYNVVKELRAQGQHI
jgi:large subunit ribosomal protein L28